MNERKHVLPRFNVLRHASSVQTKCGNNPECPRTIRSIFRILQYAEFVANVPSLNVLSFVTQ